MISLYRYTQNSRARCQRPAVVRVSCACETTRHPPWRRATRHARHACTAASPQPDSPRTRPAGAAACASGQPTVVEAPRPSTRDHPGVRWDEDVSPGPIEVPVFFLVRKLSSFESTRWGWDRSCNEGILAGCALQIVTFEAPSLIRPCVLAPLGGMRQIHMIGGCTHRRSYSGAAEETRWGG